MTARSLELAAGKAYGRRGRDPRWDREGGAGTAEIPAAIDVTAESRLTRRSLLGEAERIAARAASEETVGNTRRSTGRSDIGCASSWGTCRSLGSSRRCDRMAGIFVTSGGGRTTGDTDNRARLCIQRLVYAHHTGALTSLVDMSPEPQRLPGRRSTPPE